MSETIDPALSAEEWNKEIVDVSLGLVWLELEHDARYATGDTEANGLTPPFLNIVYNSANETSIVHRPAAVVAIANAALPDDDPRKITREKIKAMRMCARYVATGASESVLQPGSEAVPWHNDAASLRAFADALESYLPPESP